MIRPVSAIRRAAVLLAASSRPRRRCAPESRRPRPNYERDFSQDRAGQGRPAARDRAQPGRPADRRRTSCPRSASRRDDHGLLLGRRRGAEVRRGDRHHGRGHRRGDRRADAVPREEVDVLRAAATSPSPSTTTSSMPETMPLSARNKFGDVSVEGLKAAGDDRQRQRPASPSATAAAARGSRTPSARSTVSRNAGDVDVTGSNGAGHRRPTSRARSTIAQPLRRRPDAPDEGPGDRSISSNGADPRRGHRAPATSRAPSAAIDVKTVGGNLEVAELQRRGHGPERRRQRQGAQLLRRRRAVGRRRTDARSRTRTARSACGTSRARRRSRRASARSTRRASRATSRSSADNGAVILANVGGAADVRGSFGKITVTQVKKGVRSSARTAPSRSPTSAGRSRSRRASVSSRRRGSTAT